MQLRVVMCLVFVMFGWLASSVYIYRSIHSSCFVLVWTLYQLIHFESLLRCDSSFAVSVRYVWCEVNRYIALRFSILEFMSMSLEVFKCVSNSFELSDSCWVDSVRCASVRYVFAIISCQPADELNDRVHMIYMYIYIHIRAHHRFPTLKIFTLSIWGRHTATHTLCTNTRHYTETHN